ncbi:Glyoxalase-like domain protein [Maioricimonas rarisocia]|uniref:Glyoxalase-like domain protein n=1 Tax=Maioricimonas rarisocia TaxID=2528026 RepID=A0A517Z7B7_9PLAN|nr:VOC family protein [Maioricimonas rarisocia]QDU38373.1 Glyoxalase-like domain protein [Maioricimonas rarisocia]
MRLVEIARFVDDVASATRFYRDVLGREPNRTGEGVAEFDLEGVTLRLHAKTPPAGGMPPVEDHLAFEVHDLDAAVAAMEVAGHRIEMPPATYPWGRAAWLRDPEGRLVELCGRSSSVTVSDR